MSLNSNFRISAKLLIIHSLFVLLGVTIASVFLRFSSDALLDEFSHHFQNYFIFSSFSNTLILILQECFWILLIIAFAFIPHGKLIAMIVLLYKGYSIGTISSIACRLYGLAGIKYIILTILPQNILYIVSLCIATQISWEISANTVDRGRHGLPVSTDSRVYVLCFVVTVLAGFVECYVIPLIYNLFF